MSKPMHTEANANEATCTERGGYVVSIKTSRSLSAVHYPSSTRAGCMEKKETEN